MERNLTIFLIVLDTVIAIFCCLGGNYAKFLYWISAASITLSTLFMK